MMTINPYPVVVMDINMPVTNGWEALRIIKDSDGWPETEVIIMTVQTEPENALKAWSIGARYYLPKPFSTDDLCTLVKRAGEYYEERAA